MTKIYNLDTGGIHFLWLPDRNGNDILRSIIEGCSSDGDEFLAEDMPDGCDFAMTDDDIEWWETWAMRERRINDRLEALGVGELMKVPNFYDQYLSWEDAQTAYEKYLGIEE